ncbi:hypothetical protein PoB_000600200 [Plakobranchus ocellatus]|uniref:Uncharacterized protein n=1 Tax=Plakobranchus ocellatus TaxID=259542 RepID=A0AAV3YAP3_9GAST|nr:hypothetical protein PoB_000600200 [Plakobranchus ocellatus]
MEGKKTLRKTSLPSLLERILPSMLISSKSHHWCDPDYNRDRITGTVTIAVIERNDGIITSRPPWDSGLIRGRQTARHV